VALATVPVGGRASGLVLGTIAALFAVDFLIGRIATGTWQANTFSLAVKDPTIIPIQITMVAGFVLALYAPRFASGLDVLGPLWIPATLGLLIATMGIAIRAWSILSLGTAFSRVVRVEVGQKLVTTGPYRVIRHPSYAGVMLAFTGIGVIVGNWLSIIALALIPTIGFVIRILVEERVLRSNMGRRYDDYARGQARLIPGVW
jgi:protein-S-isoprenylcysteine O-methyltransferase Ste14